MREFVEYSHVQLQDGCEGAIVEIIRDKSGIIVELLVDIGSSPAYWDNIVVAPYDIE